MVRRSLVLKIYLYAVAVLLLTLAMVLGVTRQVFNQGVIEGIRSFHSDIAAFAASEIATTVSAQGAPSPGRLATLSRSLHVQLEYVPWRETNHYPATLVHDKVLREPGHLGLHRIWARVDGPTGPQGALLVEFRPFRRPPHPPLLIGGALVLIFGLILIPPLMLWVISPLRRMVGVAHRLGEGDLSTPIPVSRSDEFGELERAFEGLRVRIQQMLEQKDRLLIDISHELRGPLSRISVALPMAAQAPSPYLAQIERNVQSMDQLIGELLALARGRSTTALAKQAVDLSAIAQELLSERELLLGQRRQVCQTRWESAPVAGEASLLKRAMGNLLDNAIKYTPAGGELLIKTGMEGTEAVFRVRDNGPGIPAGELPHLFEPFYRPDTSRTRETGGTGLGLSIARAIAERHGGNALLSSVEGEGTTAELRLPAAPRPLAVPEDIRHDGAA